MTDFRARTPSAPLGIGKRSIGEPIPDKYKVRAKPEPVRCGTDLSGKPEPRKGMSPEARELMEKRNMHSNE